MKRIRLIVFITLVLLLVLTVVAVRFVLPIATSYGAKTMCSCMFVGERGEEAAREELYTIPYVRVDVDMDQRTVAGHVLGLAKRAAIYREGLGCTLVTGTTAEDLRSQYSFNPRLSSPDTDSLPWPTGNQDALAELLPATRKKLDKAMDWAFSEPSAKHPRNTRAIVIVHQGKIVAERYAAGVGKDTPLKGWSMAKSVTSAMVGILVRQGKIDIHDPVETPEWKAGDPRSQITLDQLLRMSSGLAFEESYGWRSDATKMLFLRSDAAAYAASLPLKHTPDEVWNYSSGSSNLISRVIRDQFEDQEAYLAFPYRELFDKTGMNSAQFEPDPSGTYLGSSFLYATARDWARFGLLYLQEGEWEGEQILSKSWVEYTRTRTSSDPVGRYGAHFWISALAPGDGPKPVYWPSVPSDAYYASGHEGQQVFIVPSKELVVVRLGLTPDSGDWDIGEFVPKVLEAFP